MKDKEKHTKFESAEALNKAYQELGKEYEKRAERVKELEIKEQEKQIEFKVIDNNTGKEADIGKIALKEDWAKDLMYCDMQGFAILDDGNLVLLDECGKYEYCPSERFSIKFEDSVVLSREEYEEYQVFKNGDYCATKCDIHELSFNQMNKISDLENENEKLKKEIKNPNEVLEDRERFRARNEELKEIAEQLRQEIITLSQELVNSRKETAEKILKWLKEHLSCVGFSIVKAYFKEQFGVEINE